MESKGVRRGPVANAIRAFLVFCLVVLIVYLIHRYQVSRFMNEVQAGLAANGEDPSLAVTLGYPDLFMKDQIYKGKVTTREDVDRLMHGYARSEDRTTHNGENVAIYVFRVGLIPFDDPVVFVFDDDGMFQGMPIDGANWR